MFINFVLTTILTATDNTSGNNGKGSTTATKTDVKIKNNGGDNNGTATMELNKPISVENVYLKTYSRPKDSKSSGDSAKENSGKNSNSAKSSKKNSATDNTSNNTGTDTTTNGAAGSAEGTKKMLKQSNATDSKNLKPNEFLVTTKDNKTTVVIGQSSFNEKDLSFIYVSGKENKSSGKSTSSDGTKSSANDGSANADGKNTTSNGKTGDANNGTAGAAADTTTAGDGTLLEFVSKDGIIISDGKLTTQSLKDFNDGKTANSSDGSVWKSWWFWLIVVAGLVLIVFIIFYFCGGSSD